MVNHSSGAGGADPDFVTVRPLGAGADDSAHLSSAWVANAGLRTVWMAPGPSGEPFVIKTIPTLPSNLTLCHFPGVVYLQEFESNPGGFICTFRAVNSFGAFATTIAAASYVGSPVVRMNDAPAVGMTLQIGNQAPARLQKSLPYVVLEVSGSGPYDVTLDRSMLMDLVVDDEVVQQVDRPTNIRIYGNGSKMTGNGTCFLQIAGGSDCYVADLDCDATGFFEGSSIGLIYDTSSLNCTFENIRIVGAAQGLRFAAAENCRMVRCEAGNQSVQGIALTDCYSCEIDGCTQYGSLEGIHLDSDGQPGGCFGVKIHGGNYSDNAQYSIHILGNSNFIQIDDVTIQRGGLAGIATSAGAGTPFNIAISNVSITNTTVGIFATVPGIAVSNYNGRGNVVADIVYLERIVLNNVDIIQTVRQSAAIYGQSAGVCHASNVHIVDDAPMNTCLRTDGTSELRMVNCALIINGVDSTGAALLDNSTMTLSGLSVGGGAASSATAINNGQSAATTLRCTNVDIDAAGVRIVAGGFVNIGTVAATGAQPVFVPWPRLKTTDRVILTLRALSGIAAGTNPQVTLTPGVGFSITSVVNDASSYDYVIY